MSAVCESIFVQIYRDTGAQTTIPPIIGIIPHIVAIPAIQHNVFLSRIPRTICIIAKTSDINPTNKSSIIIPINGIPPSVNICLITLKLLKFVMTFIEVTTKIPNVAIASTIEIKISIDCTLDACHDRLLSP